MGSLLISMKVSGSTDETTTQPQEVFVWIGARRQAITFRINGTMYHADGVTVVNNPDVDSLETRVTALSGTHIVSLQGGPSGAFTLLLTDAARIAALRTALIEVARNQVYILNALNLALTSNRWMLGRFQQLLTGNLKIQE